MTQKEAFIAKVEAVLSAVRTLSDAEFEVLLTRSPELGTRAMKSKRPARTLTTEHVASVIQSLRECSNREEGIAILQQDDLLETKKSLETIARALKAHVMKQDTRDILVDKIIESAIGYRLRAEAIRSMSFRNAGNG